MRSQTSRDRGPSPDTIPKSESVADLYQALGAIDGLPLREKVAALDALYGLSAAIEGKASPPQKSRRAPNHRRSVVIGNVHLR